MAGIIVDIGTGDGEFTYKIAKENPDRLVIGIDPNHKSMINVSTKVDKKPAKGGLENAMFVLADVENLPEELNGVANQVFINFPWGSLLRAVVNVEQVAWKSIKRICQDGAQIDVVFGYDPIKDAGELKRLGIDEDISLEYIRSFMSPKLEKLGFKLIESEELSDEELQNYPSSWAKRLSHAGGNRRYYCLKLLCVKR
ncbi:methyltransferase domain-containing protein [candidate division WWE3 bacterium]|uniref:Methyltransferase domain-containing protein n=1 Tax=candidate division WWE3 bacterium TaxID=2053526 RepID=A0A955LL55_UNCKA|nr:methyltransferase domain-containing protein [candidate division WWE3 bacterium]